MLGGEAISDGLRHSAREMLTERSSTKADRARGEPKSKGESERAKGETPSGTKDTKGSARVRGA
jgi:hypothetical protein